MQNYEPYNNGWHQVDFTREPIIETVITPKEGCKLVVRSSKSGGQEEYFVDSLEVVSFGRSQFLRSTERPKAFLVPASDYEILEVREARMVLKNVGLDRSIKIAGGRDGHKPHKEAPEKVEPVEEEAPVEAAAEPKAENGRLEKKRDRRRHYRRRRGREDKEEGAEETVVEGAESAEEMAKVETPASSGAEELDAGAPVLPAPSVIPSLLPPPAMLISETIARYKDNDLFKGAFYTKAETAEDVKEGQDAPALAQPEYGSYEMSEEEEEEIYRQRRTQYTQPREDQQPFVESDAETAHELTDVAESESEETIVAQAQEGAAEEEPQQKDTVQHNGNS